jgi:hypothetical protein
MPGFADKKAHLPAHTVLAYHKAYARIIAATGWRWLAADEDTGEEGMSQHEIVRHVQFDLQFMGGEIQDLADSVREIADRQATGRLEPSIRRLARQIEHSLEYIATNEAQPNGPDLAQGSQESSVGQQMREMHEQMDKMQSELNRFVTRSGIWARMIPLFFIIVAIIAYPFYGMVTHMAPQSLAQYMAPVIGLGGAIIGYWFGRQ